MKLQQVFGPRAEPLHLDEVKAHLRMDTTDDDDLISALITAARQNREAYTRRRFITQTWDLYLDKFPRDDEAILLPYPPLIAVSSITYTDTAGTTQTFSSSSYTVDTYSSPGRVALAYDQAWPDTRDVINAVKVRFVCGYATPATAAASGSTLTTLGHNFSNTNIVRLSVSGGEERSFPSGLSGMTDYYVVSASGSSIQLSLTEGGSAVTISDTGIGQLFIGEVPRPLLQSIMILVGTLYENRESVVIDQGVVSLEVPQSADFLAYPYRVMYPRAVAKC